MRQMQHWKWGSQIPNKGEMAEFASSIDKFYLFNIEFIKITIKGFEDLGINNNWEELKLVLVKDNY